MAGAAMYQRKPLIVNGSPVIGIGGPVYQTAANAPGGYTPGGAANAPGGYTPEIANAPGGVTYTPGVANAPGGVLVTEPTGLQLPPWLLPVGAGILILMALNAGKR